MIEHLSINKSRGDYFFKIFSFFGDSIWDMLLLDTVNEIIDSPMIKMAQQIMIIIHVRTPSDGGIVGRSQSVKASCERYRTCPGMIHVVCTLHDNNSQQFVRLVKIRPIGTNYLQKI